MNIKAKDFFIKIYNFLKHGRFNNGEPISTAVKKTLLHVFIIFMIPVVIAGILYCGVILKEKTTDDGYLTVSMSSKFRNPVRVSLIPLEENAVCTGYAATEIASNFIKSPVTQKELKKLDKNEHTENYITTVSYLLDTYLENAKVEHKCSLTNFELLSDMYYHIKEGGAVAVNLPIENRKTGDVHIGIGFVTSINYTDDAVTVYLESGIAEVYTVDEFIDASRFREYDTSLKEKLLFAMGLYSINSAWFITAK